MQPVFGHTIVLHDATTKIGCGVIGGAFGVSRAEVATAPYPSYDAAAHASCEGATRWFEALGPLVAGATLSTCARPV